MFVFVFDKVLKDWDYGQAIIVAEDLARAQEIAFDEFYGSYEDIDEFFARNPGFSQPTAQYATSHTEEAIHYVYGTS